MALKVECTHHAARKPIDQSVKVVGANPWHICEAKDDAINIWRESVDGAVNGASKPYSVILVVYEIYWAVSESCNQAIAFVTGNDVHLSGHRP